MQRVRYIDSVNEYVNSNITIKCDIPSPFQIISNIITKVAITDVLNIRLFISLSNIITINGRTYFNVKKILTFYNAVILIDRNGKCINYFCFLFFTDF